MVKMVRNAVDTGAVADEDRRFADLFLCAADVPGPSRHASAVAQGARAFGEHGAGGRNAGPQSCRWICAR